MQPWLHVVGIGEDGLAGLGDAARRILAEAEILVGGRRHLALMGDHRRPCILWRSPLTETFVELDALRGRPCAVLASGDPLWYGVGKLLGERFDKAEITYHPAPSAFALAAARLGWPLEQCTCLSIHGRPADSLRRHLQRGARLLVLTEDGHSPARLAAMLVAQGMGDAVITVLERLGGPRERIVRGATAAIGQEGHADLNLVAVDLRACAASAPSLAAGLPDDLFMHDGQITKAECRAAALARLGPLPGERLWDIGAGSGAVGIEWCRLAVGGRAIAVERAVERADNIVINARRLGVPELNVVNGEAPDCLDALDPPDAIFLGGGVGTPGLIDGLWQRLPRHGRLVAHAISLAGERALLGFHERHGGDLTRLAVSRAEPIGGVLGWRALAPVTQLAASKACARAG